MQWWVTTVTHHCIYAFSVYDMLIHQTTTGRTIVVDYVLTCIYYLKFLFVWLYQSKMTLVYYKTQVQFTMIIILIYYISLTIESTIARISLDYSRVVCFTFSTLVIEIALGIRYHYYVNKNERTLNNDELEFLIQCVLVIFITYSLVIT